VIRKQVRLMLNLFFLIDILMGCAKPTEIATLPPPTDTRVSATPTLTLEQSQTASSINEIPQAG
jgi:hypothetical protein